MSDVLVSREDTEDVQDKKIHQDNHVMISEGKDEHPEEEKTSLERIVYTIEELLDIKAGMQKWNLDRPSILEEEFIEKKGGKWDPEAWSQSDSSRSASPLVIDGKSVVSEGKTLDMFGIKLEPKRDSFKQGCKVKTEKKPYADKTQRLTGRSSYQRSVPTNYRDGDSISASSYEFERLRKKDRETFGLSRDKYDHSSYSEKQPYRKHDKFNDDEATPEWMSDDPMPKDDNLNFFNSHFEEEKKAYAAKAKKKKVRISPDVDAQVEERQRRRAASIPSPKDEKPSGGKKFDINEFMKDVEYFPPEMFTEDDDGVRSKFTKFFQNQEKTRTNSRSSTSRSPAGGVLIPDDVVTGRPVSPAMSQALFAPIQPAPALVSAAANAHAIQSSNIANIIEQRRHEHLLENLQHSKKEVRGSLSVQELEGSKGSIVPSHPISSHNQSAPEPQRSSPGANAFNLLLQSMKEAGQLPDKPSPVVSGLPGHLLPHPPTRTSPVFEKLKRTLSRSPSPKDFAKAVSTVASIISSHPSIDKELAVLKQSRTSKENDGIVSSVKKQSVKRADSPKTPTQLHMRNSTASPSQAKKTPINAFTPTSVLKKMHNERKDDTQPKSDDQSEDLEKKNLDSQFMDAATTPDRVKPENDLQSKFMPFHSAPVTPKNYFNTASTNTMSVSAPGTPNSRSETDPPSIKRFPVQPPGIQKLNDQHIDSIFEKLKGSSQGDQVLMAPSAFKTVTNSNTQNNVGVIGSGIRQPEVRESNINNQLSQMSISSGKVSPRQMSADPKLAPGNGARHNQNHDQMNYPTRHSPLSIPKPQSQQQQLLQAQRMAQIQQAQLLQQQKLQEIAKLGRQGNQSQEQAPGAFRTVVTEADKPSNSNNFPPQRRLPQPNQQFLQQQQQQMFNHQQQPQRPFLPVNSFQQNQPRVPGPLPIPPMQSQIPGFPPYQQPQINPVNFAAQALVQQQLINQAARARLLAQATLFQQQPQVMQAALMAQAALVRGQAQAQAAMMLNPRNLQVMAEQMGLRQPFNANKQHRKPGSNASTPTDTSSNQTGGKENSGDNILSKWFSNDVLEQTKANADIKNAKVLSVEELEKGQR